MISPARLWVACPAPMEAAALEPPLSVPRRGGEQCSACQGPCWPAGAQTRIFFLLRLGDRMRRSSWLWLCWGPCSQTREQCRKQCCWRRVRAEEKQPPEPWAVANQCLGLSVQPSVAKASFVLSPAFLRSAFLSAPTNVRLSVCLGWRQSSCPFTDFRMWTRSVLDFRRT